jgi:DNA/RNA endonuclease YhcR with UshA esterase domain
MGVVAFVVALATPQPKAQAHHAFSAEFDIAQPVELKGTVAKLEWTNPHSWIYVDVTDASGAVTTWAVEFGSPYALLRKGLRKTDFPLGVEVSVKGYRARSGKAIANASNVALADGRGFYTGAEDVPTAAAAQ